MEFTLPIFLKLFPNMLPSTFKEANKEVKKYFFVLFDNKYIYIFLFILFLERKIEETIES